MLGLRISAQLAAPASPTANVFLTKTIVITQLKVPIYKRESIKQNIMGSCEELLCFPKLLQSLEMCCLDCLQHRQAYFETELDHNRKASHFTNVYVFI